MGRPGKAGGACRAFKSITSSETCDRGALDAHNNPMPCVSGGKGGRFPTFTTEPGQFKANGYLTMGVGKLFHDGGGGYVRLHTHTHTHTP